MAILGEMGESGVESDMTGLKDAISDSAMSKLQKEWKTLKMIIN